MYQTPALDLPPRRLPIIAAAFVIACLGYGAAYWLMSMFDHRLIRYLIIPVPTICVTYVLIDECLQGSGPTRKTGRSAASLWPSAR